MKVLLLSNNDSVINLYERLVENGHDVTLYHDPITIDLLKDINPELVISYNYRHIVKEDVINMLGKKIINLHTSYLPWNKGASPNIWSFIDDTPKGVTIHRLEKGLDTGEIIVQKELIFNEDMDTLATSYDRLNEALTQLLLDNWDMIASGDYISKKQNGKGSYHRTSDLEKLLDGRSLDYSMTIRNFKKFISKS